MYIFKIVKHPAEPKKVWYAADDDTCLYYHYECPECGHNFGYAPTPLIKYCVECGCTLDWSDYCE